MATIQSLVKQKENKNTKNSTELVLKTWKEGSENRQNVPKLHIMDVGELNYFLSCFVIECRRIDGTDYTTDTLYQICAGLFRHMMSKGVCDKNVLDTNDHKFDGFRKCLDARMKDLSSRGISTKKKLSDPIDQEDEEKLWKTG
ncbi:uncharacterized protein LOC132546621 [Ylistrum balloti]|uniref:uncharacterized protein LOC132546621 n=1 Tax=Ylistrum balloti TaxID=509963 RepID=UPI002905AECB|nr:uncharacterized protein LOC132546621 [Ylistrum balloti]